MKNRMTVAFVLFLILAVGAWVGFNPPGRFGLCRFGLTVYSGIPFPVVDLVVRADGRPAIRASKAHWVSEEEVDRLIGTQPEAWPEVLIIGTGYEGMVQVDPALLTRCKGPPIEILRTPEALRRYNELRAAGRRVAAIIHSTC
ncbi:MAG TPA: hypothetical protein EYP55_10305 [Anaerolineae bacterium]|nr:hypothetical protein [Anaerolineae bacterium]